MAQLVPLYLQSREDIARMPDLVAPIQVNPEPTRENTARASNALR